MRGLLYNTLIQNKTFYITSAVLCLFFSVLGAFLLSADDPTTVLFNFGCALIMIAPMCITVVAICSTERKTEKMLKCNFVKYTLTSGVSHIKYTLTDIAENLLVTAYSYGLCVVFYIVIKQVCPEVIYERIFIETLFFIVLGGSVIALVNALVYYIKNAEISELVIGLFFGAVMGTFFLVELEDGGLKIELTNTNILIGMGIAAFLYLTAFIAQYMKLKNDCT